MAHVFLSYSREDTDIMRRLRADLRQAGFAVWTDETGLEPGTPAWESAIEDAIEGAVAMVVLLSPATKESLWVTRELGYGEAHGLRLIPFLVRGDQQSAVPLRLSSTQRIDARRSYYDGVTALLDALHRQTGETLVHVKAPAQPRQPAVSLPRISLPGRRTIITLAAAGAVVCIAGTVVALVLSGIVQLPAIPDIGPQEEPTVTPSATQPPTETPTPPPETEEPPEEPVDVDGPYTVCEEGCMFSDLASAIAFADPTETITVGPGEFTGNVEIDKPLTLVGEGRDVTTLLSEDDGPVVLIASNSPVNVDLQGLAIQGGLSAGQVGCITQPANCLNGVVILGNAQVALRDVLIENHGDTGLWARDEANVTVSNSDILENGISGITLADQAVVILDNVTVARNENSNNLGAGIRVDEQGTLTVVNSIISHNDFSGIWAQGEASLEIRDSEISRNTGGSDPGAGLVLDGETQATVQRTEVRENGTATQCLGEGGADRICSGVLLAGQAEMELVDAVIERNTDWGISVQVTGCTFPEDLFVGSVTFTGFNTIQDNNLSGNHDNAGNPGTHPFKSEPDGQVCDTVASGPTFTLDRIPFDDFVVQIEPTFP